IAMNYENYIKSIIQAQNLGLVGWPKDVEFKWMSKQSTINPLCMLRDTLQSGTCHLKVLKEGEKACLVAQFKDMVENSEATEKPHKARAKTMSKKHAAEE
ncbi:hypothetical protein FB451DRAFT_963277, partial [Mycena latifolia]